MAEREVLVQPIGVVLTVAGGILLSGCTATPAPSSTPSAGFTRSQPLPVPATGLADVHTTLLEFLDGWKSDDLPRMCKHARSVAIQSFFRGDGRTYDFSLVWGDGCAIGPLGNGSCEVEVIDGTNSYALIYRLEYTAGLDGIVIEDIVAAGDAG